MSDDSGPRPSYPVTVHGTPDEDQLPLDDPYLVAPPPAARAETSMLAVSSVVAALFLGPVGAVAAIVFGLAARREIQESPVQRRGYRLATFGLALGVVLTMAWGAGLTVTAWTLKVHREAQAASDQRSFGAAPAPARATSPPAEDPTPPAAPSPTGNVPQNTTAQRIGELTVVDVGVNAPSLAEELAKQRAEAYSVGQKVLVMTIRDPCAPCRRVEASLRDPLMQTALRGVRLVRVDLDVFKEELQQIKVPSSTYPGFFLLSLDLTPEDGIDGGEWDDDIPRNIAPVLGAFVRKQYKLRREPWKALPGTGMRL